MSSVLAGLLCLSLMAQHGGAHGTMNMTMIMSESEGQEPPLRSYASLTDHASALHAHIVVMILAWAVLLPIAVMLSIAGSRLSFIVKLGFHASCALGLIFAVIFKTHAPDLYVHNVHRPMGWWVTGLAIAWTALEIVKLQIQPGLVESHSLEKTSDQAPLLSSQQRQAEYRDRLDHDTELSGIRQQSVDSNNTLTEDDDKGQKSESEKDNSSRETWGTSMSTQSRSSCRRLLGSIANVAHVVLERAMLPLGFAVFCTGLVVHAGIFRDGRVFGGLAHFIKGAIFLWYGLLTLGRWSGSFGGLGWAWNVRPEATNSRAPTAEFAESFLIFIYGASNFFMENLGPDGEDVWSPHNLEHVSITVLFFGGGLLGMLVESKRFRSALERPLKLGNDACIVQSKTTSTPKTTVSLNPIPAVIILLLGLMMSSHTQHSQAAAHLHSLWGNLFVAAALARGLTYVILWLKPPQGSLPSRPPTELVVAFCLVGGGGIFMASNEDTVNAIEASELDAMTIFTVGMGFTGLLMAWTLVVLAVKGAATSQTRRRPIGPGPDF